MINTKPGYLVIDTSCVASEPDIYTVAKVARGKIISEASHKDHDLRRLVGHTTLYDKLLYQYQATASKDLSPIEEFGPPEYDWSDEDQLGEETENDMEPTEDTFKLPKKTSERLSADEAFRALREIREQAAVKMDGIEKEDGFAMETSHNETITIETFEDTTFVDVAEVADESDDGDD
jgi:hypothetical protein